ncbi:MAG: roadblock/LC7 domain-containing protein [Promethearchaeota archaeon]
MELKEKINQSLEEIRRLKGVENVVLTQRDGNPIQSRGIWFSKNEIFNVSSATSAVFNVGIHLHSSDLKYLLIEGKKAKILIAPLNNPLHANLDELIKEMNLIDKDNEFFMAITAHPNVNLGGVFLQTSESLKKIKAALITSGKSFKPPLIEFNAKEIEDILEGFNLKDEDNTTYNISNASLSIPSITAKELNDTLDAFALTLPDLKYAFVSLDGGVIVSKVFKKMKEQEILLDNTSAMSYSLLEIGDRCAWLLKKMKVENILIDCKTSFQFINRLNHAIFSAEIGKTGQKLGLLRLILPQFSNKIQEIINEASRISQEATFDIQDLLGEIMIK